MNDPIATLLGEWVTEINVHSILFKIVLSVLIGAIIGCERSSKRHAAGLRTFILVSLASTVAMELDLYMSGISGTDHCFISAAAVIGVAIISTNSVLYSSRSQIKGLTTSAGLWATVLIGLAVGAGFFTAVLIAFVAMILSLAIFPRFEIFLKNRSNHFEIHLELKNASNLQDFVATLRKLGIKIDDIESNPAYAGSGLSVYSMALSIKSQELKKYKTHSEIIEALRSIEYICFIEEMN